MNISLEKKVIEYGQHREVLQGRDIEMYKETIEDSKNVTGGFHPRVAVQMLDRFLSENGWRIDQQILKNPYKLRSRVISYPSFPLTSVVFSIAIFVCSENATIESTKLFNLSTKYLNTSGIVRHHRPHQGTYTFEASIIMVDCPEPIVRGAANSSSVSNLFKKIIS